MTEKDRKSHAPRGIQGFLVEVEGVMVDIRGPMADVIRETLPDHGECTHHTFLCRHLRFPVPSAVAGSVASELGLRASARDALKTALTTARENALNAKVIRPGALEFLQQVAALKMRVAIVSRDPEETLQKRFAEWGLDAIGVDGFSWTVANENAFTEGWAQVARKWEPPPQACVAAVSSGTSGYGALVAGFRCIGVPDRFTAHHDFGGADRVYETPTDIDVRQAAGIVAA